MTKAMAALAEWFKERPKWMIKAANRLLEKGDLENQDIIDLAELCKKEAVGEFDVAEPIMSGHAFGVTSTKKLRLCSIGNVWENERRTG